MKRLQVLLRGMLVLALTLALPTGSFANLTNTASATYQDAAANPYTANSLQVVIVTPPVVTAPTIPTLDVNVTMTPVQVAALNATNFTTINNGPAGLSISGTGLISGIPAAGSAGTYNNVTVTATNIAGSGTSAPFTITVRGAAVIALTKSADVTHAVSGNVVTYTIAYQNTGSGPASNVVITDVIPVGSTYVAGSATASGGSFNSGTQTITWTIPTVNPGAPSSVSFKVTVN